MSLFPDCDIPYRAPWEADLVQCVTSVLYDACRFDLITPDGHAWHLATMREPWASWVADGAKVVESRWGKVRCAPHGQVATSDLVVWKRTGGPVYGVSPVVWAQTSALDTDDEARGALTRCAASVCVDPDHYDVLGKRFLTLVGLGRFHPPPEMRCGKKDRAGWNVLQARR